MSAPSTFRVMIRGKDLVITLSDLPDQEALVRLTPLQLERISIGKRWLLDEKQKIEEAKAAKPRLEIVVTRPLCSGCGFETAACRCGRAA